MKRFDYERYLRSPEWQEVKRTQLADNPRCLACDSPSQVVHHKTYAIRREGGRWVDRSDIVCLCNGCHYTIHHYRGGEKRPLWAANRVLDRMCTPCWQAE